MIRCTGLRLRVLHLHETVDYVRAQTWQPEVLKPTIGGDDRQCLDVRVLQAADRGIDAETGRVINIALDAVPIGRLVHDGIFPPKTLGTREVEAPAEHCFVAAIRQKGGYTTHQGRYLHMATFHFFAQFQSPVWCRTVGLSVELGSRKI